jgi:hypothetical protein
MAALFFSGTEFEYAIFNFGTMKKLCLFLLPVCMLMASCATLVPFNEQLKNRYHLTDMDIPKLQFYNSDNIVLYKDAVNGQHTIKGGKIKEIDGRQVEEIIIPLKTKGVAIMNPITGSNMGVSFEINDNYFLTFGENPKFNKNYTLLAANWNGRLGEVTYNGEKYKTPSSSGTVCLLVNVKKLNKIERSSRTAGGRKIKR